MFKSRVEEPGGVSVNGSVFFVGLKTHIRGQDVFGTLFCILEMKTVDWRGEVERSSLFKERSVRKPTLPDRCLRQSVASRQKKCYEYLDTLGSDEGFVAAHVV